MKTFEMAVKKSRRKQFIKLVVTVFCLVIFGLLGTYKLLTSMVYRHARQAEENYLLSMRIAYPNIYSYNGRFKPQSLFSGSYQDKQYKDLAGVRIIYDNYRIDYDVNNYYLRYGHRYPEWFNGAYYTEDGRFKVPEFYNAHVSTDDSYSLITDPNELRYLSQMPNQLVELAVTFDKDYSYAQIQKMVPESLKINWYWIGTQSDSVLSALSLDNVFGTNDLGLAEGRFLPSLEQALIPGKYRLTEGSTSRKGKVVSIFSGRRDIENYLKQNGHLDTKEEADRDKMTFAGVILTGRSEDFASLENATWIYATSIGASIPNQPYYQLEKE